MTGAKVGRNVRVMKIIVNSVFLDIGDNTFIGNYTMFTGAAGTTIKIGKNCDISDRVNLFTGSHRIGTIEHAAGLGYGKDIVIGDGVWIGLGSSILPGVSIGDGAIVASCACVTNDVKTATMVAGVPAVMKKELYK